MNAALRVIHRSATSIARARRPWALVVAIALAASLGRDAAAQTATPTATATEAATATLPPTETPIPPTATRASTATSAPSATTAPTAAPTAGPSPTHTQRPAYERPILVLDSVDLSPSTVSPGDTVDIDIDVRNVGAALAINVQLSLSSAEIVPTGRSSVLWKDGIRPGEERDFETKMRASSSLGPGVYSVAVRLTWEDLDGNQDALDASIGVNVGAGASRPLVVVERAAVPGRVAPGVPFDMSFQLRNTGGKTARSVTLVPTGGPVAPFGGGQAVPVDIGPGGTASVGLRVVAAGTGEAGAVSQPLEIRYDDELGERYVDGHTVGLTILEDEALGPLPMITSSRAEAVLYPGQVFDLSLDVTNVGVADALSTFLSLGGGALPEGGASLGAFAPLGTSNRLFLDRIPAGETRQVEQEMVVNGNASPGVYVLDVGLSYRDADGNPLVSNEVVTLLVSQRVSLQLNPLDVVTSTVVGQSLPIAFELINAGTSTVNVGNVEIVGDRYLRAEDNLRYVGALDTGDADLVEATLVPLAPTEDAEVRVLVHYTDDFSREQVYEESVAIEILEAPERPALDPEAEAGPPCDERPWVLRVLRGLFGLGASQADCPEPEDGELGEPMPPEDREAVPAPIEAEG